MAVITKEKRAELQKVIHSYGIRHMVETELENYIGWQAFQFLDRLNTCINNYKGLVGYVYFTIPKINRQRFDTLS